MVQEGGVHTGPAHYERQLAREAPQRPRRAGGRRFRNIVCQQRAHVANSYR